MIQSSTPTLTEFDPGHIPFQMEVIRDVRRKYDFSKGVHEVLLSGSVGSAKSLLLAHVAVTHCLTNEGACVLICRKTMPSLKDTILQKIIDHVGDSIRFDWHQQRGIITFPNGSKMISYSWADKKYKKVRSYEVSMAIIEELTENEDAEFYKEILMRVGRIPHIKENAVICATNPDAPSHWAYKYFIESSDPLKHVYYSKTSDNPFLPETYIENLKKNLSPKEAQRMLLGQWLELTQDVIYYNYEKERNFKNENYTFNRSYPVDCMFDFNIGIGKPMSCAIGQRIKGVFHVAREFVVQGVRTADILDEIADSGLLEQFIHWRVFGDASGSSKDTRSTKSDYDIIDRFFRNYKQKNGNYLIYEKKVPKANPRLRKRHNTMNAQFLDANNRVKFYVYKQAPTADEAMRLTKLKAGASYIEDDSDAFQHIGTAIGYWVCKCVQMDLGEGAVIQMR